MISPGTERDIAHDVARQVAERITVVLVRKARQDLEQLQDRTGLSKTDIVNRAISCYQFIEDQLSDGSELLIRDAETGATRQIVLL